MFIKFMILVETSFVQWIPMSLDISPGYLGYFAPKEKTLLERYANIPPTGQEKFAALSF